MFANQLDTCTNFQALENYYTISPKAKNLVNNVSFWHPTKNNKKTNNYKSKVVKCTSMDNSFQIHKNWHPAPILNNIYMNINPRLVVHSGDLITTNWNESSMLD
jgi:hypothetical protein